MHLLITSTERRTPRFVESLSSSAKRFAGHPDEPLNIVTRTRSLGDLRRDGRAPERSRLEKPLSDGGDRGAPAGHDDPVTKPLLGL